LANALPFLEEAIVADPGYGRAYAALAAVYWSSWENEWSASLSMSQTDALIQAKRHLSKALEKPTALAHQIASRIRAYENRHDLAVSEAEQAIELDPNDPLGHLSLAIALVYAGDAAGAETRVREAIRLDPYSSDYLFWLALALLGQDELDQALETLVEYTGRNPNDYWGFMLLAATQGLLEKGDEARAALDTVNVLRAKLGDSPYRVSDLETWPFSKPADRDRVRNGLVAAGAQ
jgi:predicted Zn-dependent protease